MRLKSQENKTNEEIGDAAQSTTQNRVYNLTVGILLLWVIKKIGEVGQGVPQERARNRTMEKTQDIPSPQIIETIGDVVQSIILERVRYQTMERTSRISFALQIQKIWEFMQSVTQKRTVRRTLEQTVGVPVVDVERWKGFSLDRKEPGAPRMLQLWVALPNRSLESGVQRISVSEVNLREFSIFLFGHWPLGTARLHTSISTHLSFPVP